MYCPAVDTKNTRRFNCEVFLKMGWARCGHALILSYVIDEGRCAGDYDVKGSPWYDIPYDMCIFARVA